MSRISSISKVACAARFSVSDAVPGAGPAPVPLTSALRLGENVHDALVELSDGLPKFTGCDEEKRPLRGHSHAYILCESNEPPGAGSFGGITHVTIFSNAGFDDSELRAISGLKRVYGRGLPDLGLRLLSIGRAEDLGGFDLASEESPMLAVSRCWASKLPFLPSRHPKVTRAGAVKLDSRGLQIDGPEHELRRLLMLGGYPEPISVKPLEGTILGGLETGWSSFEMERSDARRDTGSHRGGRGYHRFGCGFRLIFSEPIEGPLALGYASHFGMGAFVPFVPDDEKERPGY